MNRKPDALGPETLAPTLSMFNTKYF